MRHFIFALALLCLANFGCAQTVSPPSDMPRLAPAPSAKLRDLDWQRARFTADFSPPLNQPANAASPWTTRAKFAWDADHLYVLIESTGPKPASPFTNHDDPLYKADVLELFLDPAGDQRHIFEFQVSPSNVTADWSHLWNPPPTYLPSAIDFPFAEKHHQSDLAWNCPGLRTESLLSDISPTQTRWTVFLAIPMRPLLTKAGLPPTLNPNQSLRVNLLRYAYSPAPDGGNPRLNQFNLVPVLEGCPHISPMASLSITTQP